ncbi:MULTISPECIES: acyl-CoA dehydrogenase family protein [unclassified Micromonospora]|uniref:acyl-CoA dehydrogenase family protein n=1 Tax=unclassified Micromonospora TaxID=2617518 RepID=UPI0022B75264|nr:MULTISPECIES: acyl-CoA dehydrogenase family protein [unclassified Micromonospora]MCZ7418462.1 acyl-CoA dehydrogenase family protein [Verrucosispora sp. WMMA2121]WBB94380.1 acyl-CoA dehydrogenase family protein [Verrucosispora sp. WMMC514]
MSEKEARQVAEAARQTTWDRPSFGKELFLGRLRLDLIDPWPRPDPEEQARAEEFLGRLRDYVAAEVDGAAIERDARIPDEVFQGLARLGAFGMKIGREYGGLGLSNLHYCRALMLAGSVSPAIGALLSAHQSIGVPQPLKMFGSEEQKRRFLPRLAAGEVSAFLLTEPDVGSDPARLATTAEPTPDGTGYRINGVKLWATNGTVATQLVVMARVPKGEGRRGGITAFVVDGDAEGITVERRNAFLGLRGLENSLTRFHDVFVPKENVIGGEGKGLRIALSTLTTGRLSLPAMCVGAGKWALNVAREWSAERVQWGRPVGEHEAVAQKLSFIAATTYGMETMLDLCCLLADDDRNDIRIEAALVKLYASEMAWRIADELVQIRGGRGYETADSLTARGERPAAVEQMLRDLRINRIFEGSTEIMHLLIAREAVDAHLSVAGDIIDPDAGLARKAKAGARAGAFYARWLPTLAVGKGQQPTGYGEFGPLAGHLRHVERASRKLARSTFYAMSRWQGKMERKQAFLGRVVDIGAELFAMSAVCVRARAERDTRPENVELADLFCRQAKVRVDALFTALWENTDSIDVTAAKRILAGRYAALEDGVVTPPTDLPWVAPWTPGPSTVTDDARRRLPPPPTP